MDPFGVWNLGVAAIGSVKFENKANANIRAHIINVLNIKILS